MSWRPRPFRKCLSAFRTAIRALRILPLLQRLHRWWQGATSSFWDNLCALREQGGRWLLRHARRASRPIVLRAHLGCEELEPRLVLSGNPVANADNYTLPPGSHVLSVAAPGILANDVPGDSDPLTASLRYAPAYGTLTLNANGGFTYTAGPNFPGFDAFGYVDLEGSLTSNLAPVMISGPVPVAHNVSYNGAGTSLVVSAVQGVLANDRTLTAIP